MHQDRRNWLAPIVNLELPTNVDESSGDGYFVKAYNAVKEKNFTEALEACEKAIELGCSSQYQAYAYNLRGTFDFLKGDNKGALEALDKSIELDSKLVQSYIKRSSLYMEQSTWYHIIMGCERMACH